MKNKICMIIPYFGKFPDWIDLFIQSCRENPEIDFLFFTDDEEMAEFCGENINVVDMSFGEMQKLIHDKLGGVLPFPYKLCDYKPCYGHVFAEYLKDYTYWGHCDVDIILGRIMWFLKKIEYSKYERVFQWGHFSLYRNDRSTNNLYRMKVNNAPLMANFDYVRKTAMPCTFDEIGMLVISNYARIAFYRENVAFDASFVMDSFAPARVFDYARYVVQKSKKAIYGWRLLNGKKFQKEYMYVHFQKRKLQKMDNFSNDDYIICHSGFWKSPDRMTSESMMRFVPDEPRLLDKPIGFEIKSPASKIIDIVKRDWPVRRLMVLHTIWAMFVSNRWKARHLAKLWKEVNSNDGWKPMD